MRECPGCGYDLDKAHKRLRTFCVVLNTDTRKWEKRGWY